jgi:hypothetical protein
MKLTQLLQLTAIWILCMILASLIAGPLATAVLFAAGVMAITFAGTAWYAAAFRFAHGTEAWA